MYLYVRNKARKMCFLEYLIVIYNNHDVVVRVSSWMVRCLRAPVEGNRNVTLSWRLRLCMCVGFRVFIKSYDHEHNV